MERMAQIIKVKPEVIPEYKRIHAAVWPEILKAISDSNIRNYDRDNFSALVGALFSF